MDPSQPQKLLINKDTNFPCLVIDNWYSAEEEKAVWKELDFYTNKDKFYRSENTVTATDSNGNSLSSSFRTYIDRVFRDATRDSTIVKLREKLRTDKFYSTIEEAIPMGRIFKDTNASSNLISYYEENDYYDEHVDIFLFTVLIWFHKTPKLYTGGDLYLKDSDTKIISKHNRLCVFPCYYKHQVTPIEWTQKPDELGHGRYTITHFYYTTPSGKIDE